MGDEPKVGKVHVCRTSDVGMMMTVERPCRACSECDGAHHWLYLGDIDDCGEPVVVLQCKHCDALRRMTDEDEHV